MTLLDLADVIEAGCPTSRDIKTIVDKLSCDDAGWLVGRILSDGCLTSAQALHGAVIPGWAYEITGYWFLSKVSIWTDPAARVKGSSQPASPAKAWLAAILRALHAIEIAEERRRKRALLIAAEERKFNE